ncbi:MAG: formyltransferase family protein [Pricia sp.]
MRVALVGNNDGPLILADSMYAKHRHPVCVGLQKPVSDMLKAGYIGIVDEGNYFSDFDESRLLEELESFEFDILINCFCNFKFRKLLERYTVLNVHLAPLPRYRGRHPLHWALINGEREFGFTVHQMDADFDAGEIYWQENIPLKPGMSVEELREALMKKLAEGFGDFLEDYSKGDLTPKSNEDAKATYAPKRNPEDSCLTEWYDCDTIYRKVMALRSGNYPAYLKVNGKKIAVIRAELKWDEVEREESNDRNSNFSKATGEKSAHEDLNGKNPIDEKPALKNSDGIKLVGEKSNTKIGPDHKPAVIEQLHENGISVLCQDGKRIQLFGFNPKKHNLIENQELT